MENGKGMPRKLAAIVLFSLVSAGAALFLGWFTEKDARFFFAILSALTSLNIIYYNRDQLRLSQVLVLCCAGLLVLFAGIFLVPPHFSELLG